MFTHKIQETRIYIMFNKCLICVLAYKFYFVNKYNIPILMYYTIMNIKKKNIINKELLIFIDLPTIDLGGNCRRFMF